VKLENETALAAQLFSGPASDTELGCALIVKATYEIRDGALAPATEAAWPIQVEPLETPYGTFPADIAVRKPRTDVIVLAKAKAPGGDPVRSMTVTVTVGTFRHALAVFGDRQWERTAAGLRSTEPLPFREMPLVWSNAYGGKLRTAVGDMPNTDNPEGKGFFVDEREGEGVPLPNVEDPNALIRAAKDMPKPVGWGPYPLAGGVRVARMMTPDGGFRPADELEPWVTGWAHPDLMIERPAAGARIEVQGVAREGPIVAAVPAFPAKVVLIAGEERRPLVPKLDTLIVQAEEKRLVARWRAAATIEMRPREVRLVRIEAA